MSALNIIKEKNYKIRKCQVDPNVKGSDINSINTYHYTFIIYTRRISEEIW
jgi:hypothetical protein